MYNESFARLVILYTALVSALHCCIVHPCHIVLICPLLQSPSLQHDAELSTLAFSIPPFLTVPLWPLPQIPSTHLTVAWHISCMLSSTGWTFLIVSVTRSQLWSTNVFMARLHSPQYLLYTGHRPCHLTPSPLCQAPSARRSTLSALHLGPSGILDRCCSDLEFTARRSARSSTEWVLTASDNSWRRHFVLIVSVFSTLRVFCCWCALQV